MTATKSPRTVPIGIDTNQPGSDRSGLPQVCLCCKQDLTDQRRTALCNQCFHAQVLSTSGNGRIVCTTHGHVIDPVESGGR